MNSLRSPMAEAMLKHLHGRQIYVDSAGVRTSPIDEFAVAAMDELGIDITKHKAKSFDDLLNCDSAQFVKVDLREMRASRATHQPRLT